MKISNKAYDPFNAYNIALKKKRKWDYSNKTRRVLAKILFEKGNRHISAENLFDEVKKKIVRYQWQQFQYLKTIY